MQPETILIPLDGTPAALAALPVAAVLRDLLQATLHIVHVRRDPVAHPALLHELGLTPHELRGAVVTTTAGEPVAGILEAAHARPHPLIVMSGTTRAGGVGLGPVARAVLERCCCPVLLVHRPPGPEPWQVTRILLPYDGSPDLVPAIALAVRIAQRSAAELLVVYCEGAAADAAGPAALAAPRYVDAPQHEWPGWVQEFSERLYALGHAKGSVAIRPLIGPGRALDIVPAYATVLRPSLVVLAWEGHLDLGHGLILDALLHDAAAPVLAVPGGG